MSSSKSTRIVIPLLMAGALADADTLMLRNGSRIDGSYLGGDNRSVRFAVYDHVNTYNLSDIESVRFTGGNPGNAGQRDGAPSAEARPAPPAPGGSQAPYAPPPAYNNGPGYDNSGNNSPAYNGNRTSGNRNYNSGQPYGQQDSSNLQVPAGTMLTVRMIDPVDSANDRVGQTYRASLDEPVVLNGQTILPRGTDVVATLIDAQKSGKIEGRTSLTLDLKQVMVNGKQYDITTTGVSQESSSRGARSAKVIGGTAALGALIGAVAGGGKGAAIGAGSGAAAGTAAQVLTSGQRVKVPAETRLAFTLQNPLSI